MIAHKVDFGIQDDFKTNINKNYYYEKKNCNNYDNEILGYSYVC